MWILELAINKFIIYIDTAGIINLHGDCCWSDKFLLICKVPRVSHEIQSLLEYIFSSHRIRVIIFLLLYN